LSKGIYQLGWGSKAKIMEESITGSDSLIGAKSSHNKITSAHLFRLSGLPAPEHGVAKDSKTAQMIANQLSFPVVVKPADLDRGEGVTINITDDEHLEKAFDEAMKLSKSKQVLVEKQVDGVCHRILIEHGKHLFSVKREPKSIKGNGVDTIATLIQKENINENEKAPWKRKVLVPHDNLALIELQKIGMNFDSIPEEDVWVKLRDIQSTRWGGRSVNCTSSIHPDNIDLAIRAAKIFGITIIGVDIITTDITKPWYETGAIINEVNLAPYFALGENSQDKLETFFDKFIEEDGRIPIDVFIGNTKTTLSKAKAKQKAYQKSGLKCYLTTHTKTYDNKNNLFHLASRYLIQRVQALLLNSEVDAIIIVVNNDEFLHTKLPFDKVSDITVVSKNVQSFVDTSININTEELDKLVGVFKF